MLLAKKGQSVSLLSSGSSLFSKVCIQESPVYKGLKVELTEKKNHKEIKFLTNSGHNIRYAGYTSFCGINMSK